MEDGLPGNDGREVELNVTATHIQWRYQGETEWNNLIAPEDPKGEQGLKGEQDSQGEKGVQGDTGAAGVDRVGVQKIEKSASDGNVDAYTVTLSNGTTYNFTVTNGQNGVDGKDSPEARSNTVAIVAIVLGSVALACNIGLLGWMLFKKKRLS